MEIKTTDELNHEIKSATDIEGFLARNKEHLSALLVPKGYQQSRCSGWLSA